MHIGGDVGYTYLFSLRFIYNDLSALFYIRIDAVLAQDN